MSYSLHRWRYILLNHKSGVLDYSHSHSKIVYGSLRQELENIQSINNINTAPIKYKIDELLKFDYSNRNSVIEETLCESLSRDIPKISPKYTNLLASYEFKYIKKSLNDNYNKKLEDLYQYFYDIDSKNINYKIKN